MCKPTETPSEHKQIFSAIISNRWPRVPHQGPLVCSRKYLNIFAQIRQRIPQTVRGHYIESEMSYHCFILDIIHRIHRFLSEVVRARPPFWLTHSRKICASIPALCLWWKNKERSKTVLVIVATDRTVKALNIFSRRTCFGSAFHPSCPSPVAKIKITGTRLGLGNGSIDGSTWWRNGKTDFRQIIRISASWIAPTVVPCWKYPKT
jgi:hypothetical protein